MTEHRAQQRAEFQFQSFISCEFLFLNVDVILGGRNFELRTDYDENV